MSLIDRPVFATGSVRVGVFRCTADDPRFGNTGPAEHHLVAFPRTAVWIRHAGSAPFVADPTVFTVYNRGQEYIRTRLSADGDRCEWYGVLPDTALALARDIDPSVLDHAERPFRAQYGGASPQLFWRQRMLFQRVREGVIDQLEAEEAVLDIVATALRATYPPARRHAPPRRTEEAHRDLVTRARAELAREVAAHTNVTRLAVALGVSPYHLCRVFKNQTGETLHSYRLDLRLRVALERLETGRRTCSELAFELGFSSHSHFTAVFRRRLGFTPSEARQRLAPQSALAGLVRGRRAATRWRRSRSTAA